MSSFVYYLILTCKGCPSVEFYLFYGIWRVEAFRRFEETGSRYPKLCAKTHLVIVKQKSPSLLRNLALWTFGKLLIVFSTKVNLLYLYSTDRRCCLLHLIKQNYLLKHFPRTLILMTLVSLYLFFPSRTN